MIRILIISRFLPHFTLFLSFILSLIVKCCKTKALQRTAPHKAHKLAYILWEHKNITDRSESGVWACLSALLYRLLPSSPSTLPLRHRTLVRERAIIDA